MNTGPLARPHPISAGQRSTPAVPPSVRLHRALEIVREVAIGGLAGIVGGALVIGIGGRLFMRIAAVLDPEARGTFTSAGFRVGEVTPDGTLGFVLAGVFIGALAAVIWVTVSPWLPRPGLGRWLAAGGVSLAVGAFAVVNADEADFYRLSPGRLDAALLIGLIGLFGVVVALADAWLRRRLPVVDADRPGLAIPYALLTAVGVVLAPLAIGPFFVASTTVSGSPVAIGLALTAVGLATLARWWIRMRDGADEPPGWLTGLARTALVIAVGLGVLRLWGELSVLFVAVR